MKKKLMLSAIAVMAFAGNAMAADLAARPYTKAPPPVVAPIYNWTGFYIGVNGGGGWGDSRWQFAAAPFNTNHNTSGGMAGGQIGYNWQVTPSWVLGLEADGDWADINGSTTCPAGPLTACSTNTRSLASFRGRVGWAVNNVLFYGTAGAGYANTRYNALPAVGTIGTFSSDRWGYAAGAGVEWGFAPNWSAKVEYMHYGFDTATAPIGTLGGLGTAALRLDIDTVKAGINYRFNWGGPVVARY
ncbi:outer membrane beta-barrel protein [Bradyrhizobium sp. NP1]|uniref:outer membrane protein n=1 Tax=Bradyrhizobium sp. NP1 TaxID=3049772 RepID=UPI0025A56065|nr:outer membrane beta-barrel protein [Bradyrhizobium sp. NP1]WJR75123.1 outer membrane beta-barrel protein [Bradyrhizobium sp. NP1]